MNIERLPELMDTIESVTFSVQANVASGTETFLHIVKSSPAFQELQKMTSDLAVLNKVMQRIVMLCRKETDPKYEHPDDVAIATYLLVLYTLPRTVDLEMASLQVTITYTRKDNRLFWARHVAEHIGRRRKREKA